VECVAGRQTQGTRQLRQHLEQHGRNWLLPVLADVALDRLTGEHCAMVFERIDMADADVDTARAAVTVNAALVQVGGRLVWGRPKSKAGERVVALDSGSVASVKAHRTLRKRERLAAGEAWTDSGRMFTDELGEALHPDYVSRRFRELAKAAGLPVIRFHAARHTAATLAQRRASISRSCPNNSVTRRPGSHRTSTGTSGIRCTPTQRRKSWPCFLASRARR
jgi:integrase